MLRQRIRELERQVTDLHANSAITHEPSTPSHLLRSASASDDQAPPEVPGVEHFTTDRESGEENKDE
jgi:hypothetical protein